MAEKVGIVAAAKIKYKENRSDADISELAFEPIEKVIAQSGLSFADNTIDASVTCSQDHDDGRTISGIFATDVAGGHLRSDEKIANDGLAACCYAAMQILSGHFDTMLVVAHTKESHSERRLIENAGLEPIYSQMLGFDFLTSAAMQAKQYIHEYDIMPEQCAMVVVKSRKNARNNPEAQCFDAVTIKEVLSSKMLAEPIRLLDSKPISDGSCALILAGEEKAKRLTDNPVWLKGFGISYDTHYLGYRDLVACDSLVAAAKQAYQAAGITDPLKQIDVAEISEYFSYQELLWSERLGFCSRGEGGRFIESGATQIGGKLPINPSGGLLSGVPVNVAGLDRVVEAALQLRGEAGAHQVDGAKVALAHGTSGACGQYHCVLLLER